MKNFLLIIFVFTSVVLNAQDVILLKSGEKISGKVIEITPELVKYKKHTNQDAPIYSVYKKDVKQITFEDGSIETFFVDPVVPKDEKKETGLIDPVIPKDEKKETVLIDLRDNQKYKIVQIGEQVWMAENLRYESNQSWCYDNLPANCERYGRLYSYEAANNVCPSGWHLPSDDEWKKMEIALGMQNVVNETGWRGTSPGQGKLMKIGGKSGLDVELTGFRYYGGYENMDDNAYFWTSTIADRNNKNAFSRELKDRASVKREESDVNLGYSVRCVQGTPNSANANIPKDEKKDKLKSTHEISYFSAGIGSGTAQGIIGLKLQSRFRIANNWGVGFQYGMGFVPDLGGPHISFGTKFYYRYFYLNAQLNDMFNDDEGSPGMTAAFIFGLEYPLSKNFNITSGLGFKTTGIPVAYELGINYKIFK